MVNAIRATYVAGVDEPGDVSVGGQLSVHKAADLTVLPPIVDVNQSHHVPLQQRQHVTHQPLCPDIF